MLTIPDTPLFLFLESSSVLSRTLVALTSITNFQKFFSFSYTTFHNTVHPIHNQKFRILFQEGDCYCNNFVQEFSSLIEALYYQEMHTGSCLFP